MRDIKDTLQFEQKNYYEIKDDALIVNILEKKPIIPITMYLVSYREIKNIDTFNKILG